MFEKRADGWQGNFFIFLVFICLGLALYSFSRAEEKVADTRTLQALVKEWIQLRQQIALEEQTWQEEKIRLQDEAELLRKEKQIAKDEITRLRKMKAARSSRRLQLLESRRCYQASLEAARPAIRAAEGALLAWQDRLPLPLFLPLRKHFQKLKSGPDKSLSQRLQTVLALYAEIDKLQYSVNVGKQALLMPDKKTRECDVLYIGLAQGYCVSQAGRMAGIGRPVAGTWEWTWRPELAPRVRKGLEIHSRQKIAEYITLPLKIEKD